MLSSVKSTLVPSHDSHTPLLSLSLSPSRYPSDAHQYPYFEASEPPDVIECSSPAEMVNLIPFWTQLISEDHVVVCHIDPNINEACSAAAKGDMSVCKVHLHTPQKHTDECRYDTSVTRTYTRIHKHMHKYTYIRSTEHSIYPRT